MAVPASLPDASTVQVPKTNRNPIRSIRPAPVVLAVGTGEIEIPPLPAADWLEVLMQPDWNCDDLVIDLVPNGINLILDRLDLDQTEELTIDILEEVTGRHWWIALRLIGFITDTWDVMGPEATFHHVDPERLSLAAWLDAMLVLLMQRLDKDQAALFVARLESPPMGEEIPVEEMEISERQFLSMAD